MSKFINLSISVFVSVDFGRINLRFLICFSLLISLNFPEYGLGGDAIIGFAKLDRLGKEDSAELKKMESNFFARDDFVADN